MGDQEVINDERLFIRAAAAHAESQVVRDGSVRARTMRAELQALRTENQMLRSETDHLTAALGNAT